MSIAERIKKLRNSTGLTQSDFGQRLDTNGQSIAYRNFYQFMDLLIAQKRGLNAENTIKTHETLKEKLKIFKPELSFAEIDEVFIGEFQKHMKLKLKNNLNTQAKMLRIFKIYMNAAKKQGLIKDSPFQNIKIKQVEAERSFLDPDELKKLVQEYRKPTKINLALEMNTLRAFLFSCFTGLRISDLQEIKMENVIKDTLVFIPVKTSNSTNKTIRVPLTKPALMLLKDAAPHRLYGKIFEFESEQKMNKRIKDICKLMAIGKNISFHCGRHTFATIFLREGGKLHILQKLMGHYSIQETMKYVHILPDDTEEEMLVFNRYF